MTLIQFFEKNLNCVAKLGNGQMTTAEKTSIKEHWMDLAPHLKAIAESQDVPLWNEYNEIRNIIRKVQNAILPVSINLLTICEEIPMNHCLDMTL